MTQQQNQIAVLLPKNVPMAFTYSVPAGIKVNAGDFVVVPLSGKTEAGIVWGASADILPDRKIKAVIEKLAVPPLNENFRKFIDRVASYTMSAPGNVLKMALSSEEALSQGKEITLYERILPLPEGEGNRVKGASAKVLETAITPITATELKEKTGCTPANIKKLVEKGLLKEIKTQPFYKPETVKLSHISLSDGQLNIASKLKEKVHNNCFSTMLLDGVTGSGKTEVYLSAVEELFKDDSAQVLILLPEIALTGQVMNRLERKFGFKPLSWHSGMTKVQKEKVWRKVANGGTRLIVGARSALFLPFKNLKLIIIDEEHDSSYKQEEGVIYNARNMAVLRAKIENIPIILASATPSIETIENVESGKYQELRLPHRHGGAVMPGVSVIDMRGHKLDAKHFLSPPLINAIRQNIEDGKQSLLFLNRRGYAPLVLCRTCGFRFKCEECSTWLVQHKHGSYLMCHHCGFKRNMPDKCPECSNEGTFASCGPGVERIEEEVSEFFPDANIALMASDSLTHKKMAELIDDILANKIDIIIGTQVIAKGHHFPNLTLVGIVDSDLGLEGGDLRASERTYQLLHQVAGRAGRESDPGRVILQSYMPDNAVMHALKKWDRDSFIQNELVSRKQNFMPPFSRFAALIISGHEDSQVSAIAKNIVNLAPKSKDIQVLGPVPAPIFVLRGKFRYRILIKCPRNINIQSWIARALAGVKVPGTVKVKIDIDPYSFL